MQHRWIVGLSVSVVGLGCNQLGTAACDETVAARVVGEALDAGITFFDTSDEYGRDYANPADISGWGRSEEILGRTLRNHRDAVLEPPSWRRDNRHTWTGDGGRALAAESRRL